MKPLVILQPNLPPLDPHTATDDNGVRIWRHTLYEALVEYDSQSFTSVLAESWRCAEDARTWTFTVREGVRFHDGKSLTAGDDVYSLRRAPDRTGCYLFLPRPCCCAPGGNTGEAAKNSSCWNSAGCPRRGPG